MTSVGSLKRSRRRSGGMADTLFAVTISECRTANDFKCANNLCLPKSVKCDGYDHCGDGSDEYELCGAFRSFLFHTYLHVLLSEKVY